MTVSMNGNRVCSKCGNQIIPRRYSAHWTHVSLRLQETCCKSPITKEMEKMFS